MEDNTVGVTAFPIVSGAQVTAGGDTTAKHEPGTIMAYRSATDQWALVEYVQAGNNIISRYLAAVTNLATLKQYSVDLAGTGDRGGANFRGIALATIASQKFGFVAIGGYVEFAFVSETTASGEYLTMSGSTAGQLTPDRASVFNNGTQGNASAFVVVAYSKAAYATTATAAGSIQLIGVWA